MKKFICVALILGSILDLQALQLSQYHRYQSKDNGSFSKSFDKSTDLIRGIISLREGIFEQQRLYGNIDFVRMKSDTIGTCSYTDKGLDSMMQLLVLTHPSSGGSGFNADGSGSIGQIFAKKENEAYSSDVIKIIATMFKLANEVRRQTTEILKDNVSLSSEEIKNRVRNVDENIFRKLDAVNNIVFTFNDEANQLLNSTDDGTKTGNDKKTKEKAKVTGNAKEILSEISGKTYAQLVDEIRNLEKDIDEQKNEIKRLEKKEIKAYRKKVMEEKVGKEQLEFLHNYENSIKESIEERLDALDTLVNDRKISDSEDVKKAKEDLEKLKKDIVDTWKNDFDIPNIRSIISIRKESIKKILSTVRPINAEIMKIEKTTWLSKSFFGEYTNQLDIISRNIKVNKLTDASLLDKIRQQKKVLETALNDLIKKNFETIKRVTDSYGIALNPKNESDLPKIKKLIELTDAVSGAVLLERYDTAENQDNNHPYWLGYANNIICAYTCAVISGESTDAQLEELAAQLRTNREENQDYVSDLTNRLFQERKDSRSVIPFDVGVTPITNGTTAFKGNSYADCVETTMRQFCSFLFSEKISDKDGLTGDVKTDLSRIPDGPLKDFFAPEGRVLDIQSLANDGGVDVREKWSNVCGGHSDKGIWYSNGANGGYELHPDWNSMIKLFCLLMKNYPTMPGANKAAADLIETINADPNYQLETEGEHSVKAAINTLLGIRNDVKFTVKNESIAKVKISKNGQSKDALIGAIVIGLDTQKEEESGPSIENNNLIFEVEEKHAFLHRIDGKTADRSKKPKDSAEDKTRAANKFDKSGYFHIEDLYESRNEAFLSGEAKDVYTLNNLYYPVLGYFARIKASEMEGFHNNFRDMLMSDFGGNYLNGIAKIMFGDGINYTSLALRQGTSGNTNFQKNIEQLFGILKKNAIRAGELSGPMSMMLEINGKFSSDEEATLAKDIMYDLFDFAPRKVRDYLLRIDSKKERPLDMSIYEVLPKYGKYIKGEGKQDPHPVDISKIIQLIKRKSALRGDVCAKLAKEYHDVLIEYINTESFEDTTYLLGILGDFIKSEKAECIRLSDEIKGIEDEISKLPEEKEKEQMKIKEISDEIDELQGSGVLEELTTSIDNLHRALEEYAINGITNSEKSRLEAEEEKQRKKKQQLEEEIDRKKAHKEKLETNLNRLNENIGLLQTTLNKKNHNKQEHISSFNKALGKILTLADLSKLKEKDVIREYVNSNLKACFVWDSSKYVDEEKIELILPITKSITKNAPRKEVLDYLLAHKAEKYNEVFATLIRWVDNKADTLKAWLNDVPQTEESIYYFLANNNGNGEIGSSVIDYYKRNKTIDVPTSIINKIWTDFPVKTVLALMEEVNIGNVVTPRVLGMLVSSRAWRNELMKTCRDNVIKEAAKKMPIANCLLSLFSELIRYPLSEDALYAIANNICKESNVREVRITLLMGGKNGKFILRKIGEILNEQFKDCAIPMKYAQYIVGSVEPEKLEDTLKRIDFKLSANPNHQQAELKDIMGNVSTIDGVEKSVENWVISLCKNEQKLPIWFASIIKNYLSEKLVDLIDLSEVTTCSVTDICEIINSNCRPIFMKKLSTHYNNRIPMKLANSIICSIPASEIQDFLSNVDLNYEDKTSFVSNVREIMSEVKLKAEILHQVLLYVQKYCESKNEKLPVFLAKFILLNHTDIAPFLDAFPPEYPALDNFFQNVQGFARKRKLTEAKIIIDKFIPVDQIDSYASQFIEVISTNKTSEIRKLLVKKISEKYEDPVGFLIHNASGEDKELVANVFVLNTDLDAETFTWGSFIHVADHILNSHIDKYVQKIGNELGNMPVNLVMFVENDENRRKLADEICKACQKMGIAVPYSLSILCLMSDECLQEYFDRLDKTTFNKNDIAQLLSAGADRELSEGARLAVEDSSRTVDINKKKMSGANEAAQYILQNMAEDCNFDKQTAMEIVKAVRKADIESLKVYIK